MSNVEKATETLESAKRALERFRYANMVYIDGIPCFKSVSLDARAELEKDERRLSGEVDRALTAFHEALRLHSERA